MENKQESIFAEADRIINNDRRQEYGSVSESFSNIALMWSGILDIKVSPKQVALCMITLKIQREKHLHKRDNLVDICGYAGLIEHLHGTSKKSDKIKLE